jgi:hypothetical protein
MTYRTAFPRAIAPQRRVTLCRRLAAAESWRAIAKGLFDPYRPERHYMRGPGPKWNEKHARSAVDPLVEGLVRAIG